MLSLSLARIPRPVFTPYPKPWLPASSVPLFPPSHHITHPSPIATTLYSLRPRRPRLPADPKSSGTTNRLRSISTTPYPTATTISLTSVTSLSAATTALPSFDASAHFTYQRLPLPTSLLTPPPLRANLQPSVTSCAIPEISSPPITCHTVLRHPLLPSPHRPPSPTTPLPPSPNTSFTSPPSVTHYSPTATASRRRPRPTDSKISRIQQEAPPRAPVAAPAAAATSAARRQ